MCLLRPKSPTRVFMTMIYRTMSKKGKQSLMRWYETVIHHKTNCDVAWLMLWKDIHFTSWVVNCRAQFYVFDMRILLMGHLFNKGYDNQRVYDWQKHLLISMHVWHERKNCSSDWQLIDCVILMTWLYIMCCQNPWLFLDCYSFDENESKGVKLSSLLVCLFYTLEDYKDNRKRRNSWCCMLLFLYIIQIYEAFFVLHCIQYWRHLRSHSLT